LDDLYTLITQLNYIQFVFMFDMGYDDNLNMRPMSAIVNKDKRFVDSGYLSMFTASNKINL